MNNKELNERYNAMQNMYLQKVCKKHEYIFVNFTVSHNHVNTPSCYYQCKNCGKLLNEPNQ